MNNAILEDLQVADSIPRLKETTVVLIDMVHTTLKLEVELAASTSAVTSLGTEFTRLL